MIRLYDNETGASLGEITEEQLRVLVDQLEEESTEDNDYYLDRATLDLLEEEGADPSLMSVLRAALGSREDMEIRWSRS